MRSRVRGLDGGDADALVRERLRSILAAAAPSPIVAAATPRIGWVPERIVERGGERPDEIEPTVAARSWPPEILPDALQESSGEPDSPSSSDDSDRRTGDEPASMGRHRGAGLDRGLRWDPGRPGALALCLVAVLAALLATGLTWWSRPSPSTVDGMNAAPVVAAAEGATDDPGPGSGAGQAGSTLGPGGEPGSGALIVSVIGQVHQPGLVSVTAGARVADAIAAAGGALPEADLSTVNLARLVVDGEQIAVGIPGSALPGGADPAGSAGLVNLNTASLAELEELPGIGPVLAQRITDFREANGGFTAVEELREVSGVGPTVYEDIVDLVTV